MYTFRGKGMARALVTVTVEELIEILQQYPNDMPVITTYEGIHCGIAKGAFEVEHYNKGWVVDSCPTLIIDVEEY